MILDGKYILIVEDEALIALDLADTVAYAGGDVVGPVATIEEAMALLAQGTIDGAICDAMLADRDVTPLALDLVERGIPLVLHTATGPPPELAARHADLAVVRKPAGADRVVAQLAVLLQTRR